ncbi:MAG: hypothetical protein JXL80_16950 [Planctomycetes bacterium]|nr:hypothetical protein [Planctomycetota bacterium]
MARKQSSLLMLVLAIGVVAALAAVQVICVADPVSRPNRDLESLTGGDNCNEDCGDKISAVVYRCDVVMNAAHEVIDCSSGGCSAVQFFYSECTVNAAGPQCLFKLSPRDVVEQHWTWDSVPAACNTASQFSQVIKQPTECSPFLFASECVVPNCGAGNMHDADPKEGWDRCAK